MKKTVLLNIFLIIALLAVFPPARHAAAADVTHHYLILSKTQGSGSTNFLSTIQKANGKINHVYEAIGVVSADSNNPNFVATVKRNALVQNVSEDVLLNWLPANEKVIQATNLAPKPAGVNSEEFSGYQWNLWQIHADDTAAEGYLGQGARVAVLDSGIMTNQPDLVPNLNLALSTSFVPDEPDLNPPLGMFNHGSHVAGIIAAAINDYGIQGVAPEAEIVAVKVLGWAGSGQFDWVIEGILYAAGPDVNADVINMSLGATFDRINTGGDGMGPLISALNRAINYATGQGTLVVSAAGNAGVNLNGRIWSIPAQSGNGMAIAATGPYGFSDYGYNALFDRPASYTNYGQSVINVAAPGGDYMYPGDGWYMDMVLAPGAYDGTYFYYYFAAGTSMAAPHVSGEAALIVGKYGHIGPAAIKAIIQQSADDILTPGNDGYSGKGRINAWAALNGK